MELRKGLVSLNDLKLFYQFLRKNKVPNSFEEDLIRKIELDLLFSLTNIKSWFSSFNEEDVVTSIDIFIDMINKSKEINDIIVTIDTIINAYHEMGPFLENLINAEHDKIIKFLDERSQW
jgi:hypothetical protein